MGWVDTQASFISFVVSHLLQSSFQVRWSYLCMLVPTQTLRDNFLSCSTASSNSIRPSRIIKMLFIIMIVMPKNSSRPPPCSSDPSTPPSCFPSHIQRYPVKLKYFLNDGEKMEVFHSLLQFHSFIRILRH